MRPLGRPWRRTPENAPRRRRERVLHQHAGHRGQRVLPRLTSCRSSSSRAGRGCVVLQLAAEGGQDRKRWRLALGLLDTLVQWQLTAPVIVGDAGYGVSPPFRLGLRSEGCPMSWPCRAGKPLIRKTPSRTSPLMAGSGRPTSPATAFRREPSRPWPRKPARSDSPK
ncbi:transposase [Streptomyces griseorubiginosus]|uniref:transposase n=1 Tax=Streptomyces griseorubiginosus TaxID=67304 RepID=UPI00362B8736